MAKATQSKNDGAFGLDGKLVASIDWSLALSRVLSDVATDFIWAPHFRAIYRRAGESLIAAVRSELSAGTFTPGTPITMEVPKSFRMRVGTPAGKASAYGPSFTRPGSILLPKDRLLYQAVADQCAPLVEADTNKKRSFSHRLAGPANSAMFLSNRFCWNRMQDELKKHSSKTRFRYVVKLDISDYFRSINQHQLVNNLADAGLDPSLKTRLEAILSKFIGQRSSRGIIQGVNASDLFGAFYLSPIDRQFQDRKITSVRYVDDIYVFVPSIAAADTLLRWLIPALRLQDLALNEMKSIIMPKELLKVDQPDLEELFDSAMAEAAEQQANNWNRGYGFQQEWGPGEEDEEGDDWRSRPDLKIEATKVLFDSIREHPGQEEHIERFCLPLLTVAESPHALDHVLESFAKRPSMAQIYMAYLAKFLSSRRVRNFLTGALGDAALYDWQRMWVVAGLVQHHDARAGAVRLASEILEDGDRHQGLRAAAAIFVAKFGDHGRRIELFDTFTRVPEYVQLAIYHGSRRWPAVERRTAKSTWMRIPTQTSR